MLSVTKEPDGAGALPRPVVVAGAAGTAGSGAPAADWAKADGDRITAAATPINSSLDMALLRLELGTQPAGEVVGCRLAARAALGAGPLRLAERADLDLGRWPGPGA